MRGRPKPRKGPGMLAWRSRQKPGAIMKPETFEEIKRKAAGKARSPEAVAGAAYQTTLRAKYKESQKRHSCPENQKFDNPDRY